LNPLNLAFVGCGGVTRLHSRTLSKFRDQVRLFYASRSKEKAIAYNQEFKGQGYFDSYEAALRPPEIEIILIATPPALHLELTLEALQAGKHVIVEKPPFLCSSDFDEVARAANKTGKQVLISENYFYKPLAIKLREIIKKNWIGEILFIQVNALKLQKCAGWRNETSLAGGGALFEGGIHWINFMANLGFEIEEIKGFRPGSLTVPDRSYFVGIKYKEGQVGALAYSWEIPSLFKGLRISKIYGKEGSITFESNGLFILAKGKVKRLIWPGFSDISGYKAMFKDFLQAIRNNCQPLFSFDLAKRDLQYLEKIYESKTRMK